MVCLDKLQSDAYFPNVWSIYSAGSHWQRIWVSCGVKHREDEHVQCAMRHKGGDVKNTRDLNLWRWDSCCTMEWSLKKSITTTTLKGFVNSTLSFAALIIWDIWKYINVSYTPWPDADHVHGNSTHVSVHPSSPTTHL